MNRKTAKVLEALDRVEEFLEKNSPAMEGVVTSAAHDRFSGTRRRLKEYASAQEEQTRLTGSIVVTTRALTRRLRRKHMEPIGAIAQAELPDVPELEKLVVSPRTRQVSALIAAADGMAKAARVHEAAFLSAGLAPEFIDRLVAAAEAVRVNLSAQGQARARRIKATAGVVQEASRARRQLRVLTKLVRAAIEDNDPRLAEWRSLSRVVSAAARSAEAPSTPGPIDGGGSSDSPSNPGTTAGGADAGLQRVAAG